MLLAVGGVALVAAAPVAAKGPLSGEVCGRSGCEALRDPGSLYQTLRYDGIFSLVDSPRAQPFYRLRFGSKGEFQWDVIWAPAARVLRADDSDATQPEYGASPSVPYWRSVALSARAALRSATRGIDPYSAQARWQVPVAGSAKSNAWAIVAIALVTVMLGALGLRATGRARRSRAPSVPRRLQS